jgi:hypothetical protein
MGLSDNPEMQFNLEGIIDSNITEDMNVIFQAPFSDKEIEEVVKHLPNDKSPGVSTQLALQFGTLTSINNMHELV